MKQLNHDNNEKFFLDCDEINSNNHKGLKSKRAKKRAKLFRDNRKNKQNRYNLGK